MGEPRRQDQRKKNGGREENHRMLQARCEFIFQEYRRDSHANAAERLAVQLQWHADIVDCGRVIKQLELLAEIRVHHLLKIRAVRNRLPVQVRIGVQNRVAISIDDRRVINNGDAAHDRIHHRVQITVGPQIINNSSAHCFRVIGVDACAGQVRSCVRGQIGELRIQVSGGLVRGHDSLPQ